VILIIDTPDGSNLESAGKWITQSPAEDTEPAWSPDGKRIAFASLRDGNKEIYVMNTDGSNLRRLTNDPASDSSPRWSADGRILFTSNRAGQADVYVMDAAGGNVSRLTTVLAKEAAWAPDGRKVTFVSRSPEMIGGQFWLQIWAMDADGSNVRMVTRSPHSTFEPTWSPDGSAIAFTNEYHGTRANIFEIDSGGEISDALPRDRRSTGDLHIRPTDQSWRLRVTATATSRFI
jgi:tol-pal system beta propeller repeat protein TolB